MKLIFLNVIRVSNRKEFMEDKMSGNELMYSNTVIYNENEKLTLEEMAGKFAKGIEELFSSIEKDRDKINGSEDIIYSWIRIFREEEFTKSREMKADYAFGMICDNDKSNKYNEAKEGFLGAVHDSKSSGSWLLLECIEPYLKK